MHPRRFRRRGLTWWTKLASAAKIGSLRETSEKQSVHIDTPDGPLALSTSCLLQGHIRGPIRFVRAMNEVMNNWFVERSHGPKITLSFVRCPFTRTLVDLPSTFFVDDIATKTITVEHSHLAAKLRETNESLDKNIVRPGPVQNIEKQVQVL